MKQLKTCLFCGFAKFQHALQTNRVRLLFFGTFKMKKKGPSPFLLGLTSLNRLSVSFVVDLVQWRRAKHPLSSMTSINQNTLFELKIGSTSFYIPQATPRVTAEMF
jgi:hypothetical protein